MPSSYWGLETTIMTLKTALISTLAEHIVRGNRRHGGGMKTSSKRIPEYVTYSLIRLNTVMRFELSYKAVAKMPHFGLNYTTV
eukprot:scaffold1246_cov19-Prasinocladus_malaysianus.AAC.2